MTKLSPTQRSLAHLRNEGWTLVAVVEKWNPHARIRQDLFGFIDVLAIRRGETLAVQACSRGDIANRVRKIAEHPNVAAVREAGWAIHVHGWGKLASSRKVELRTVDVS
jgi:carbonic anhydrase